MKQSIQIIGGRYRGKKISFPLINNLRPTANRIKETLFNWLMHDIRGAICLDAFAGSGSLGLEAFSRGAQEVIFIEQDIIAYKNLNNICKSFQAKEITVINNDVCAYLKQCSRQKIKKFDIIFLDPPFSEPFPHDCLSIIDNANLLADNGLVYIEYGQEVILDETVWQLHKQKKTGQVVYALYTKKTL